MARPMRGAHVGLAADPTRRARILHVAQVMLTLGDFDAERDRKHPMYVKFWAIVDALQSDAPVILRSSDMTGLPTHERLPQDRLWRLESDGAVTPYGPEESDR